VTAHPDRVVTVDWSAAAAPREGADSIWVCVRTDDSTRLVNPTTRREAEALLADICALPRRTLIAADVALSYPAGSAAAAGLTRERGAAAWQAICAYLEGNLHDDHRNRNNRWSVAADLNQRIGAHQFWGAPSAQCGPWLPQRRPAEPPLPWFRRSEEELRVLGLRPASPWQLLGVGSVGSQALTFIPVLERLRRSMPSRVRVWPIETGLAADPWRGARHRTIITETWTTLAPAADVAGVDHPVRDARQVTALARHLAGLLRDGVPLFRPPSALRHSGVLDEEGWVLGVL
jgi:precorrin-8X/cobalt-precorrin-8 methylmutase